MAEIGKSKIFLGCRALGYISNHVPLIARFIKRRKETLLVTSVGKWFHTYGCNHFSLLSVSGAHPGPITCLSSDTYHVYTASECDIFAWRRGSELKHTYKGHKSPVHLILPFGILLISIDEDSLLKVWYIKEEEQHLEISFNNGSFQITTIMHPNTYLNKILLGSEQGSLQLWNIKTSKMIYEFKGWKSSITVLEQAPAIDVAAIGLANGKIILHNLKVDETIMEFTQDWGLVTSITFRTDGHPIMVTGSTGGHLVMWNLEERKVASQVERAHTGAVAGAVCLPCEPLMATNSSDNSVKLWIFDMPDGGARLLRIREGHSSPPCVVRHAGPSGRTILSAGMDSSLRILSSAAGHHPESLGRASYNRAASKKKKRIHDKLVMPAITHFSTSMQRDKEWDSIAAMHSGLGLVTTWSYSKKRMGDHKLLPPKLSKGITATCLIVSHCGNFVFIGYSNGEVYTFNMQSGLVRGRWGDKFGAHKGPVRGIETDTINSRLVTVGQDLRLKIWTFKESKLPFKILKLDESVSFTRCHRESSLIALCNEDFTITLVDIDTANIVRKFDGHRSKINDGCFSHDSRWFISTAMDCTVRTWDIPSGQLIDVFKLDSPCTSVSMAPNGDFLATTHANQLGVYLWANRTLYAHVNLKPIDVNNLNIPLIDLPTSSNEGVRETLEEFNALNLEDDDQEFKSPEQISDELITLSNLPTSRWQNLLHLDTVKQRNKPVAPPKVPKAAPFFLPTISNLEVQFDLSDANRTDQSKLLIPESFVNLTAFGKMLQSSEETEKYSECVDYIKKLGPSMIDFEISSLMPDNGGTVTAIKQFLHMINFMFRSNQDFDLAQSYLSLFLKTHGNTIVETPELLKSMEEIKDLQLSAWKKMQDMLMYNLCVVKSLKNM